VTDAITISAEREAQIRETARLLGRLRGDDVTDLLGELDATRAVLAELAAVEAAAIADDHRWLVLCRTVGRSVVADAEWSDPDDAAALRESLTRVRLAAAAERQAHEARAWVLDVQCDPATGAGRIVAATPTGDRREERELLVDAVVAFDEVRGGAVRDLGFAMLVAFLFPWLLGDPAKERDAARAELAALLDALGSGSDATRIEGVRRAMAAREAWR